MTKTKKSTKNPGDPVVKQVTRKVQRMMLKVEGVKTMAELRELVGDDNTYIDGGELVEWLAKWNTANIGKK